MARRLFAVIVAALLMGLVFGGLRVYDSESDASQFSRVSQLANLGERLTVLVNDLQNERDGTLLALTTEQDASVVPLWAQTHQAVGAVQRAAAGIGGLPSNIADDLQTVLADIGPARISALESALNPNLPPQDEGAVMGNYDADINDMIVLADQVSQGVSNASLTSDVEALNAKPPLRDRPGTVATRRRRKRTLSHVYRHDLNWLISDFTARAEDMAHAAVVSADGVPLALSDDIPDDFAEHLAAITSGLASLMAGAARIFEAGLPVQALCEMDGGLMIIKAVSDGSSLCVLAGPDCDTDVVSYEMSRLVEAVTEALSPALRGGGQPVS